MYLCLWTVLHTFATIVFGKVATKKVSKNTSTAAPSKASDWFLHCLWKKIQQQGWGHRFWHQISTISSWNPGPWFFFVHIWFLPCVPKKTQIIKATSLKQIGSGRIRRPGLISSHQSANFIGLPGKRSGHGTSIHLCDTYWLEFVEYFLDGFLNLFICQHYVTFKFMCSNRASVTTLQIQISRTLLWSIWYQVLQGVKGVRCEIDGSSPFVQVFENKNCDCDLYGKRLFNVKNI